MQRNQLARAKSAMSTNPYEGRVGLVYTRVSSKKQETEGTGLQSQETRCIGDLRTIGVPYLKTFPDSFSGGTDFMKRPAMREMLAFIDANPLKEFVVVFDDLARFARNVEFHLKLRAAFKSRNVMLRCLNYSFDDSPEGEYVELIMAGSAELFRKQNRRQVVQKMKARAEAGYWPFARKRGYNMVHNPAHGKIAVPNKDGEIIREALEGFASASLLRQIDVARFLVERNFWGKGVTPERCLNQVKAMLQDCFHCGDIEYPPWDVTCRAGHHAPLISRDTFERIQIRMRKAVAGARERVDMSEDFPLRGVLICPVCSKHLTAAWSKRHTYAHYFCQNRACALRNKTLRKKDVEDDFKTLVTRNALKVKVEPVIALAFERVWKQEVHTLGEQESRLEQRRKDAKEKIAELSELARKAQSAAVRGAYEMQMETTAQELEMLGMPTDKADLDVPYRTALGKVMGLLKSPYTVWQNADLREKQRLFYFLFEAKLPYDKKEGYRTGDSLSSTRLFEELATANYNDVDPARIGLAPLQCECSVLPLNYGP